MKMSGAGRILVLGVAAIPLLFAVPVRAAVIVTYENPVVSTAVASYIVFNDGRQPVIVGDNDSAGGQFDASNPAPAVWSETVQALAEANSDNLFHVTRGTASLTRTWITSDLLTLTGQVSAAWDDNVPDAAPGTRAYSTGFVLAHNRLVFEISTPTQLTLDYSLNCCHSEFSLLMRSDLGPDTVLFNAFALSSIPSSATTGTFSQLLLPNRYLLAVDAHMGLSSDYSAIPGALESSFDLRLAFADESTPVPEAGTAGLLALGLMGLMFGRNVRRISTMRPDPTATP